MRVLWIRIRNTGFIISKNYFCIAVADYMRCRGFSSDVIWTKLLSLLHIQGGKPNKSTVKYHSDQCFKIQFTVNDDIKFFYSFYKKDIKRMPLLNFVFVLKSHISFFLYGPGSRVNGFIIMKSRIRILKK